MFYLFLTISQTFAIMIFLIFYQKIKFEFKNWIPSKFEKHKLNSRYTFSRVHKTVFEIDDFSPSSIKKIILDLKTRSILWFADNDGPRPIAQLRLYSVDNPGGNFTNPYIDLAQKLDHFKMENNFSSFVKRRSFFIQAPKN
jgi:hypothetical protein